MTPQRPLTHTRSTRLSKGPEIAEELPLAHVHQFNDRGHVVIDGCAISMMNQFMADPTSDPDSTCVDELAIAWQ